MEQRLYYIMLSIVLSIVLVCKFLAAPAKPILNSKHECNSGTSLNWTLEYFSTYFYSWSKILMNSVCTLFKPDCDFWWMKRECLL